MQQNRASTQPMALQNLAAQPLQQQQSSGLIVHSTSNTVPIQLQPQGSEVFLHVYDLNSSTKRMNVGAFHLGVEVYGQEIFFSVEGILSCKPAGHKRHIHKQSVHLGHILHSIHEVKAIITDMGEEWTGSSYTVIGRNCQSFAVAFVERLGFGKDGIPADYCRQSDLGAGWRDTTVGGAATYVLNRMMGSAGSQSLGSIPSRSNSGKNLASGSAS